MINIFGPINNLGFGIHCTNMVKALVDSGEKLSLTTIGNIQTDPYYDTYIKKSIENLRYFSSQNPSVHIFHESSSHQFSGSPAATFAIFETDNPGELSLNMLQNGPSDIILVTTEEHREILSSYISKPIYVVHEGIDPKLYNPQKVEACIPTGKFTFITVGKREVRKNTDKIVRAFLDTCQYQEAALICHTFNPFLQDKNKPAFEQWIGVNPEKYGLNYGGFNGKYHLFSNGVCDVILTTPEFTTREMKSLYNSANVGIQCSSGEAWDLPYMEMLACGLPVIATECIGHKEYMPKSELNISVDKLETANDNYWFRGDKGKWSVVTIESIRDKIDFVIKNQDKFKVTQKETSSYITSEYSWSKAAETLKATLS